MIVTFFKIILTYCTISRNAVTRVGPSVLNLQLKSLLGFKSSKAFNNFNLPPLLFLSDFLPPCGYEQAVHPPCQYQLQRSWTPLKKSCRLFHSCVNAIGYLRCFAPAPYPSSTQNAAIRSFCSCLCASGRLTLSYMP
jgi:hypothetical protein